MTAEERARHTAAPRSLPDGTAATSWGLVQAPAPISWWGKPR